MNQPGLFDGKTFDPAVDFMRLNTQLARVWRLMKANHWMTLDQIRRYCGGSEAGISARLRDLRKARFGGHTIERRRRGNPKDGLWEYRLLAARTAVGGPSRDDLGSAGGQDRV